MGITIRAYAKVNWSLSVKGVRPDGYHLLDMLMQPISLYDELSFENSRWLRMTVEGQGLPVGGRNLVMRAAQALNDALGTQRGAVIRLRKAIPARAGLGGGSADCAAALVALNRLWNLRLPLTTLVRIGATLGADVPFCLTGGLAHVSGVGDVLSPIDGAPRIPLVLVTPGGGLSTPQVFSHHDEMGLGVKPLDVGALADCLRRGDLEGAQALSCNALEAPAVDMMPQIGAFMQWFREQGAPFVRMSGSGSTVFAAFEDEARARALAEQVPGAAFAWSRA
ncbi:MAG: 4-(cytidine 5'-diphospho)-2-C-methyl-D-erythritol kinase, partial [Clostridiales bacterium]|nr:4-(cytidine 5'-diphospho)-2-C-methyl-D-erythritol kinase [Clostridiales bacterium]